MLGMMADLPEVRLGWLADLERGPNVWLIMWNFRVTR